MGKFVASSAASADIFGDTVVQHSEATRKFQSLDACIPLPFPRYEVSVKNTFVDMSASQDLKSMRRCKSCEHVMFITDDCSNGLSDLDEQAPLAQVHALLASHQRYPDDALKMLHNVAKFVDRHKILKSSYDNKLQQLLRSALANLNNSLQSPQNAMQLLWSLGKIGVPANELKHVVLIVCKCVRPMMSRFSPQEVSNTLWGLAKIAGDISVRAVQEAASQVGAELCQHAAQHIGFRSFCPHGLSNVLWSIAKLDLRLKPRLVQSCLENISKQLAFMSPQGLANSLWAVARVRLNARGKVSFCMPVLHHILQDTSLRSKFLSQELSMALWAVARIFGRDMDLTVAQRFAQRIASEAATRLDELSSQSVSNIAWALGTLQLASASHGPAREFLVSSAAKFGKSLNDFPPQVISNMMWALSKVSSPPQVVVRFGAAAARVASESLRLNDGRFTWQDHSSLITALMHARLQHVEGVQEFAANLVNKAADQCHEISTQSLLNVAVAAFRLHAPHDNVAAFTQVICKLVPQRPGLTDIDARQLKQIRYLATK